MDTKADLAIFFSDFGDSATVALPGGDKPIVGNVSTWAREKMERPGGNNNSGWNSFAANNVEINMHGSQMLTAWLPAYDGLAECPLTIHSGDFAGQWTIRIVERDGDIARFLLNKQ